MNDRSLTFGNTPFFQAIKAIANLVNDFIETLDRVFLMEYGMFAVSLWDLIVGFLIIGFAITVFWKGARA